MQHEQNAPALGTAITSRGSNSSGTTGALSHATIQAECVLKLAVALEQLQLAHRLTARLPSIGAPEQNVRNALFFAERALIVLDRDGRLRAAIEKERAL